MTNGELIGSNLKQQNAIGLDSVSFGSTISGTVLLDIGCEEEKNEGCLPIAGLCGYKIIILFITKYLSVFCFMPGTMLIIRSTVVNKMMLSVSSATTYQC